MTCAPLGKLDVIHRRETGGRRCRSRLALVEHYQGESNPLTGLEILDHIKELAAPHDEWRTIVENKRAAPRPPS